MSDKKAAKNIIMLILFLILCFSISVVGVFVSIEAFWNLSIKSKVNLEINTAIKAHIDNEHSK